MPVWRRGIHHMVWGALHQSGLHGLKFGNAGSEWPATFTNQRQALTVFSALSGTAIQHQHCFWRLLFAQ